MTIKDLKSFLVENINGRQSNSTVVNREILDRLMPEFPIGQLGGKEVTMYQINGTIIFVSKGGITMPRQVVFFDITSGTSFLQAIEH